MCQLLSGQCVKYLRFLLLKKKLKDCKLRDLGNINCPLACMSSSLALFIMLLLGETDQRTDKISAIDIYHRICCSQSVILGDQDCTARVKGASVSGRHSLMLP